MKKKGAFKGEFVPEPSSDEDDAAPIEAGDGKDVDKWFVQRKTQWSAADQGAGGGGGGGGNRRASKTGGSLFRRGSSNSKDMEATTFDPFE